MSRTNIRQRNAADAETGAQAKKGWVAANVTCLHKSPDPTSEVVTQAKMGEGFSILEEVANPEKPIWWRVALDYDGYEGFLAAQQARVVREAQEAQGVQEPRVSSEATVRNLFGNVYSGPKVQHQLLVTLPLGVRLTVRRAEGEWTEVTLADGRGGFIHTADLSSDGRDWSWTTAPELRASLVRTAQRFLGIPYRWGGTSSFGFDCSGLVQHVYGLHGLFLPRDANQQAGHESLRPVEREELAPGDLLFFAKHGHVGMAVSHHQFIHATTHQDPVVQISFVDDPHWVQLRDEIRRYVVR